MTKTIPSIYTLYISNRQASRQERTATQMNQAATAIYVTHNNLEKISRLHKIIQCLIVYVNYLTLMSPLVSEERVFELGDFPMIAFFAFTSDCFTLDIMLFDCF